jgi:G3E family GTPase
MTPLLLVAGFLGAGKTTFLRDLLPRLRARGRRARVLLNDFGDARLDGATLADLTAELVALDASCVCCESWDDLLAALSRTPAAPGEVAIVETNGGTDTAELLTLLGGQPAIEHLSPPLQLTVIDARRFGGRGWQNVMEREQIATATHLFVSRLDLVSDERRAEVEAALAPLGGDATRTTPGALAEELAAIGDELRDLPLRSSPVDWPAAPLLLSPGARRHSAAHHFAALHCKLPGPIDGAALLRFLAELPPEVLRAKGIVQLRDPPGEKRSFQKVGDEAEISPCRLADPETIEPAAVFVGPTLPVSLLEAGLARLLSS